MQDSEWPCSLEVLCEKVVRKFQWGIVLGYKILNAEEELKRRSSIQGIVVRPIVSLHVDVTNDSGSMNRQLTPRLGSKANMSGDMEGVEGDELSNHNFHPRHMHRMSSMSPSSESPLRRPAHVQHSAVKLVKCIVQNMIVDISFNQLGGLCTLRFLEQILVVGPLQIFGLLQQI